MRLLGIALVVLGLAGCTVTAGPPYPYGPAYYPGYYAYPANCYRCGPYYGPYYGHGPRYHYWHQFP